jgi:UDP-4-amino-4,6-dideoxy-N-acetyl-beta-L-altrosamine transaminase
MIPYSTQTIDKKDITTVIKTLKSQFLTQGPQIKKFEKLISQEVGAKYVSAVNSATSALHISCLALGFKKNDILWTTPNTFVASANCALHVGGKVDFVDIDYKTSNIDVKLLEKKLILAKKKNKLPKIVVPVHFAGYPTEQDKIYKLAKKFKFKILEDASHSIGARYKGEKVGSCKWSDITVFSFHPVKIITTFEGGAAITNNKKIYEKLKLYSNHGITKNIDRFVGKKKQAWQYEQQLLGFNFRMSDVSASIGISQIKKLNQFVLKRNKIAQFYEKFLDKKFLILPTKNKNYLSSYHLYVIKIRDEYKFFHEKLFNFLRKKNINVNLHYIPVHLHPFYKSLGFKKGSFKNSEKHSSQSISLPIFPNLSQTNVLKISNLINNFFKKKLAK